MTYSANDNSPGLTRFLDQRDADIVIRDYGSVWGFTAQTVAGRDFLKDEVSSESWQWNGSQLVIDHRPARHLFDSIEFTTDLNLFLI